MNLVGQVRRYVYNDVVRLDDLERLIDCSFVQVRSMMHLSMDRSLTTIGQAAYCCCACSELLKS